MDWKCGSNSRVFALQVRNPELKPQCHKKKKKKKRKYQGKKDDVERIEKELTSSFLTPYNYAWVGESFGCGAH
jgi:hypothetical protein